MKQRGVALVTALLVVALATTAAVSMVARQQVDIRRTGNLLEGEQAYLYLLGIEDWATQILRQDQEDSDIDHLNEDWTTILPPIEVEGGQVGGFLEDLQGRFNINNLVKEGRVSEPDLHTFRRLLAALSLDEELVEPVIDWLDADVEPMVPSGAEDGTYLAQNPAYRTANGLMVDASELRLVAGVDAETWQVLAPYVTALPGRTAINVNTASLPVLMSLADELTEADAEALVEARGDEGFKSESAFFEQEMVAGREVTEIAVSSNWFGIHGDVEVGRIRLRMHSTLWRGEDGASRILRRAQGAF
ncbi:type II secretion system minor pseudopilin GspK [Thiohalomonas denitrificans]|uniref:Type II secretion system protein K n=1 Tax=Thiohalomonas denitrificans TaxID=415747 RepID=A0A1G5QUX9_9GAMM|nr:type II secretion system minor pseudopilin GspK [Thiohalomonas denitrificans]SCZ64889.1 general secretion pathway protein K [Thiohalomonas denitrificans]